MPSTSTDLADPVAAPAGQSASLPSPATGPPEPRRTDAGRIGGIDSARGAAMLFVFIAHFGNGYFATAGARELAGLANLIGMVASPTFMAISGVVLGYLFVARRDAERLRDRYLDRGLFLLTIGRVFVVIAHVPMTASLSSLLRVGYITDVIGVALILGALIVPVTSALQRVLLGLGMLLVSAVMQMLWMPRLGWPQLMEELLIGSANGRILTYDLPLVPWVGFFLVCTALGEPLADPARRPSAVWRMAGLGSAAAAVVIALRALLGDGGPAGLVVNEPVRALLSPTMKFPPSPAYFLFFGGAGLVLLAGLLVVEARGWLVHVRRGLAMIGETSLFVFLVQFYVYYTVLRLLALPYSPWWPAYFVVSIAATLYLAREWHRRGLNRYLTVRYPAFRRRWVRTMPVLDTREPLR